MTTSLNNPAPNPWKQTGSFDTAQYQTDYNPLISAPSNMQLPDVSADLTEFVANIATWTITELLADVGINISSWTTDWNNFVAQITALFGNIWDDIVDLPTELGTFFNQVVTWWDDIETDITDAVQALFAGNSDAFWMDLLTALGFSSTDISAFITWISAANTNATNAWNNWETTLTNLGQATLADLTAFWNAASSNAATAYNNWDTFFTDLGFSVTTASEFATWLTDFYTDLTNTWDWLTGSSSAPTIGTTTIGLSLVTDLENYLTNINSSGVWTGTITDLGDLADYLANINTSGNWTGALTTLGTTIETYFTDVWDWLTGSTSPPSGGTQVQAATLPSALGNANLTLDITDIISSICTALGLSGSTIAALETALGLIPNANVTGTLGSSTAGETFQAQIDAIWQAFTGQTGTGNSLSALSNVANQITTFLGFSYAGATPPGGSVADITQSSAAAIAARAVTKPGYLAIDASADSVFPIAQISGATPTYVSVTPSIAVIGYIGTPDAGVKQTIIWLGETTTNATAIYLTVYSVNTSTGALTKLFTSANILSAVSNSLVWNYYDIPSGDYITSAQGDWFAIEMMIEGAGADYQIAGLPSHWLPANTSMGMFPQSMAAQRTSLTSAAYDAVGGNAVAEATTSVTATESHTAALGADVLVFAAAYPSAVTTISSWTVTYNGVSMTEVTSVLFDNTSVYGQFAVFRLAGGGTGSAETISVTAHAAAADAVYLVASSVSYQNVSAVYSAGSTTSYGDSSSLLVDPVGVAGGIIVAGFAVVTAGGNSTVTAGDVTGRKNISGQGASYPAIAIGDNTSIGNFAATATAGTTEPYACIAVVLEGTNVTAPSTISSPVYSSNVPWFGIGGAIGVTAFPPDVQEYSYNGTFTYTVPGGMAQGDYFDIVILGGGGGGHGGNLGNNYGQGGSCGSWTVITLRYGTGFDIPLGTTSFTVVVGAGGAGGSTSSVGSAGGSSTVTITGYSGSPISASGGAAGASYANGTSIFYAGVGVTNEVFGPAGPTYDTTYYGGAYQTISNEAGESPGGGGAGGSYYTGGGNGASGAVWITAYQNS